VVLAVAKIY